MMSYWDSLTKESKEDQPEEGAEEENKSAWSEFTKKLGTIMVRTTYTTYVCMCVSVGVEREW